MSDNFGIATVDEQHDGCATVSADAVSRRARVEHLPWDDTEWSVEVSVDALRVDTDGLIDADTPGAIYVAVNAVLDETLDSDVALNPLSESSVILDRHYDEADDEYYTRAYLYREGLNRCSDDSDFLPRLTVLDQIEVRVGWRLIDEVALLNLTTGF